MKSVVNILVLLLLNSLCLPLSASEQFPVPDILEKNVDFWVNIYTVYTSSDIVIHDSENLDIVYSVINLDEFFPPNASMKAKWTKIENEISNYRNILSRLNSMSNIDVRTLTDEERDVFILWANSNNPQKYIKAANNIRGQRGLCQKFKAGLIQSGRYIDDFKTIFREYDLPDELCYLPHVESSFVNYAYSKSGAAGLWQFIRSTGRLFMKINNLTDERLDPYAATRSAARLLKSNYEILDSWPLAITAYNHGVNGMARAKNSLKTDDLGIISQKYKSGSFGFASRNFYTEFIAAKRVAQNYKAFFGEIEFAKSDNPFRFEIPENTTLVELAKRLRQDHVKLAGLNPSFRPPVLNSSRAIPKGYVINIPNTGLYDPYLMYAGYYDKTTNEINVLALEDINEYLKSRENENKVDLTKPLFASIDVDFEKLENTMLLPEININQSLNSLNNYTAISLETGSNVNLVVNSAIADTGNQVDINSELLDKEPVTPKRDTLKLVQSSEPYGPIAPAGLVETIPAYHIDLISTILQTEVPNSNWITVLPDETLGHYANWLNLSTGQLRLINSLQYRKSLHVGQRLKLSFANISADEFNKRRLAYHKELHDNFFTDYSITGIQKYQIMSGDTIWKISKQKFNVPYWLISLYNKDIEWDLLKPGDEITIPIISPLAARDSKTFKG